MSSTVTAPVAQARQRRLQHAPLADGRGVHQAGDTHRSGVQRQTETIPLDHIRQRLQQMKAMIRQGVEWMLAHGKAPPLR